MSDSVRLVLVRHGRTAFNASGRIQGRIDNPLDEVGRRQARALGVALSNELRDGAVVVHSPLLRAAETARAIVDGATSSSPEPVVDDGWIELDYGSFDGLLQSEIEAPTWEKWRSDPTFRPPGGESLIDVEGRVREALERVRAMDARTVIAVSHVSPIKAAVTVALGVDAGVAWRTRLDPASVCRLELTARGAALVGFNDVSHLSS